jgi:sulfate permease, SulP family
VVWLAGVRPDLLACFGRLDFDDLLNDRLFPQGADEDSATLAAIRRIRAQLGAEKAGTQDSLYYRV